MSTEITNRPCPWNGAVAKAIYFEFIAREQCAKCAARRRCGFGFLAKRNEDRIN